MTPKTLHQRLTEALAPLYQKEPQGFDPDNQHSTTEEHLEYAIEMIGWLTTLHHKTLGVLTDLLDRKFYDQAEEIQSVRNDCDCEPTMHIGGQSRPMEDVVRWLDSHCDGAHSRINTLTRRLGDLVDE